MVMILRVWVVGMSLFTGVVVTCHAATIIDTGLADVVERGAYLAKAGHCIGCHTQDGGELMAGGVKIHTPVGDIVSTNITPSKTGGIGLYSKAQFVRALRDGIRADGQALYPAMPYTAYAHITDDDANALYVYLMQGVAPVDRPAVKTVLPFPASWRQAMVVWNLFFADGKPFVSDARRSDEYNRGAYLVRGLGHCGTCHTPRNMLMAETPAEALWGHQVGVWVAPNITADINSGVGGWSEQELVDYLRDGRTAHKAQAAGPMAAVIDHSLNDLRPDDLRAMAVYLKNVPAHHQQHDSQPVHARGEASDDLASIRGVALPANADAMSGAQLYDAHCASCHQVRGQGTQDAQLPALFHNTATGRNSSNNMVLAILGGIKRKGAMEDAVMMPAFADVLSDVQIATLGNYLMSLYGHPQVHVTPLQVASLRSGVAPTDMLTTIRCIGAGVLGIVLLCVVWAYSLWRAKRRRRWLFK